VYLSWYRPALNLKKFCDFLKAKTTIMTNQILTAEQPILKLFDTVLTALIITDGNS
jgi:hypothetical protein